MRYGAQLEIVSKDLIEKVAQVGVIYIGSHSIQLAPWRSNKPGQVQHEAGPKQEKSSAQGADPLQAKDPWQKGRQASCSPARRWSRSSGGSEAVTPLAVTAKAGPSSHGGAQEPSKTLLAADEDAVPVEVAAMQQAINESEDED